MHGHLVTVEVGVERSTHKRVQLYCLSFDQFWLECLYREAVQCRGTVKKNRMSLQNIFKNIPNNSLFLVNKFSCTLHCLHYTSFDKLADDEWLEQLSSHIFWKT